MLCWSLLSGFLSLWAGLGFVLSYSSTPSAPPLIWQIGAAVWHQAAFPAPLTGMCHLLPQQEMFCHIRNVHLGVGLFVHDNMDAKFVYPQCVCVCVYPFVPSPASRPSSLHSNRTPSSNSNNNSHLTSPLEGKGMLLYPVAPHAPVNIFALFFL